MKSPTITCLPEFRDPLSIAHVCLGECWIVSYKTKMEIIKSHLLVNSVRPLDSRKNRSLDNKEFTLREIEKHKITFGYQFPSAFDQWKIGQAVLRWLRW